MTDVIYLSTPWLPAAALGALFLLCVAFYLRRPSRFRTLIPCVALGCGLMFGRGADIYFDNRGVTMAGFRESRTITWRNVASVQVDVRGPEGQAAEDLRFVGRNGEAIVVPAINQIGRRDAVILGEFLKTRLPGPLGFKLRARLPALQSGDYDWHYHFVASPGA